MEITASVIPGTSSKHGEGALWHGDVLYWVDIDGHAVHRFDPATGKDAVFPVGSACGTVVPRKGGGLVVALADGFAAVDLGTGKVTYLLKLIEEGVRANDGKCDPAGRFWAGTMAYKATRGAGTLYRLDPDRSLHVMLRGVSISNGIVWTSDRTTMYYIDTPTGEVWGFRYDDATGAISDRWTAFKVPPGVGHADGMTIDDQDRLWIALWGGARVCCFDPKTGEILHTVHAPGSLNTSSCALGGPGLDELYITTSCQGIKPEDRPKYPQSGSLFRAKVPARGVPACAFAG